MIGAGAAVVEQFHWVLYLFGAFLVASGIKMLVAGDQEPPDVGANPLVRFLSRHLRIAADTRRQPLSRASPIR
ncbi:hypothetical protein GCM10020258_51820 [Sphingomonas yabuuchiae]